MAPHDSGRQGFTPRSRELVTISDASITPALPASMLSADLLERVSDAFLAIDTNGRVTYANQEAARLFARTPAGLIGRHLWAELPEAEDGPFHTGLERALREQQFVEFEACHQAWDRWFEVRVHPSPDGLSIFLHESTERRRIEAAARQVAALLKAQSSVLELVARRTPLSETLDALARAVETLLPDMLTSILLLDSDGVHIRHGAGPSLPAEYIRAIDGEAIGPSAGSCGTAAFRREPVIVDDIAASPLWADYRVAALAHGLRACWSTPILDAGGGVLGTFAIYLRTPGTPLEAHRRVIEMVTHTAAIAITQEREAAEAQRRALQFEQAERLAELGSYIWEVRTGRVHRSGELCRIFGVAPEAFPPTFDAYLERVHPEDRDQTRSTVEAALRSLAAFEFEERIVRPDGQVRNLHSQGGWILDEQGAPVTLVGICQDVTERTRAEAEMRRAERLRARNEELKSFAFMISHDLKAPLRAVAGYARELAGQHADGLDDRGRECVRRIQGGAADLDRLIDELLDYARLEAEAPTTTDVDLAACVEGILRDQGEAVRSYGTRVEVDLQVKNVCTWERGLRQILHNLIDNAIKFSRQAPSPDVRISSEAHEASVRVVVADNGIGFDPRHRDRIFGLFHRLAPRETFEGSGAGLAVVRKVAEKLGASVQADARPGGGATFVLDLPTASPGR